jgi:uncharacterized protein YndB with AHSA1/START domain
VKELGSIEKDAEGRCCVRFVRQLEASPDEVWAALTERDSLDGWLGRLCYEPRIDSALTIDFGSGIEIFGRVLAIEAPRLLSFSWSDTADVEAPSVVRFELFATNRGTRLELTHSRQPVTMARSTAAGWHAHLDLLSGFLESAMPSWDTIYPPARAAYAPLVESL